MSKQVKTVGMLLALSALPMGAAYAGNVTSQAVVQNAQADAECKGVVFDATGEPMIGASVVVKGKSGLGTVTDIDGNFTLRNVKKGDVIRIAWYDSSGNGVERQAVEGDTQRRLKAD